MKGTSLRFTTTAARRLPCASLLLSAAAVLIFVHPSAATWLQYDRLAIAAGEIWRLVSSHWTHASGDHLVWDVLMFVVLGTLCERMSRMRFCACVLGSAILISVALWITMPQLKTYRGLSGIDSALYVLLAVMLLKDEILFRLWSWVMALSAVLLAFIGKVSYEIATGGTIFVDSTASHMIPVPLAHCVGAAVGMIAGLMRTPHWAREIWRDLNGRQKPNVGQPRSPVRWNDNGVWQTSTSFGSLVNDVHSQLNPTRVDCIISVDSVEAIQETIRKARREGKAISIAGGRHAMGAQQFGTGMILVDTTRLNRVLNFDQHEGTIEVEAGIQWPELIEYLLTVQKDQYNQWGIVQKQTGADLLSIGGAIAANVHGRGLCLKPIIADIRSLVLVDAYGNLQRCNRQENTELFHLVVGGYGLFGIVYAVTLHLGPRPQVQRVVELVEINDLMSAFEKKTANGFLYGDFQFSCDEKTDDFLRKGVLSCYRPAGEHIPIPRRGRELSAADWEELIALAHTDKGEAFRRYAEHYLSTSGQIYWSDTHQLSTYLDDYHRTVDQRLGASSRATEIITELYVPRDTLSEFMDEVRDDFRKHNVNVIYGTTRLIQRDDESFLAWAKESYACIIFNLHTIHTAEGLAHSAAAFRRLIDMAIRRGGSYYLTYHKYATREQVLACYPQFPEFLRLKRKYDPEERFQSDWYHHHRRVFDDVC